MEAVRLNRSMGVQRISMRQLMDKQSVNVSTLPPRRLAPVSQHERAIVSEYAQLTSMGSMGGRLAPPTRRVALVKPLKRDGLMAVKHGEPSQVYVDPLLQRLEEQAKTNQRESRGYRYRDSGNNNAEDSAEGAGVDVRVKNAGPETADSLTVRASSQLKMVKELRQATPLVTEAKSSTAAAQETIDMYGTTLARYRRLVGMVARKCVMRVYRSGAQHVVHQRLRDRSARTIQFKVTRFLCRRAQERSANALQRVWRGHVARQDYAKTVAAHRAKMRELALRRRVMVCRCIEKCMQMHLGRKKKIMRVESVLLLWIHKRRRMKAKSRCAGTSSIIKNPVELEIHLNAHTASNSACIAGTGGEFPLNHSLYDQVEEAPTKPGDVAMEMTREETQHTTVNIDERMPLCGEENKRQFALSERGVCVKPLAVPDPVQTLVDPRVLPDKVDKEPDEANGISREFSSENADLAQVAFRPGAYINGTSESTRILDVIEDRIALCGHSHESPSEMIADAHIPFNFHRTDRMYEWRLVFDILYENCKQNCKRKHVAAIRLQTFFRSFQAVRILGRIRERAIQSLEVELEAHLLSSTQENDFSPNPWGDSVEQEGEMRFNYSSDELCDHPYLPAQNAQIPPGVRIDRESGEIQALWTWSWKSEKWESLLMQKAAQ